MDNGVTIWLNGSGYWFENAQYLEEILAQYCNKYRDALENNTNKDCMEYDD